MDWLEFFSALVWPLVAVVALVLFLPEIRALIPRIKSISAGSVEVVMEEAARRLEETRVQQMAVGHTILPEEQLAAGEGVALVAPRMPVPLQPLPGITVEEASLANEDPVGAIAQKWSELRVKLYAVVAPLFDPDPASIEQAMNMLNEAVHLPPTFYVALEKLRVAHDQVEAGAKADAAAARGYIERAKQILATLDAAAPAIQGGGS